MNILSYQQRKNVVKMRVLPTVYEGACDWRRREITAKPPIRPKPFGGASGTSKLIFDN